MSKRRREDGGAEHERDDGCGGDGALGRGRFGSCERGFDDDDASLLPALSEDELEAASRNHYSSRSVSPDEDYSSRGSIASALSRAAPARGFSDTDSNNDADGESSDGDDSAASGDDEDGDDDVGALVGDESSDSDSDSDIDSEGEHYISSSASSVLSRGSVASALGAAPAAAAPALRDSVADRIQAARAVLANNELAVALDIFGLVARISSNHMELLYRLLHAAIPEACRAARLPKRHRSTKKLMAKAERKYRGDSAGFIPIDIPVTDEVLIQKRVSKVTLFRRTIREAVTLICQNRQNAPGSLRQTGIATPGEYGDVMNSPMLLRIQDLTRHVWAASGIPEDQQLTLWTAISGDGTDITRGGGLGVEASTLTVLNLDRGFRTSKGNVKLLSVFRIPSLHNPTVSSQKKKRYKPTDPEYEAIRWVS